MTQFTEYIIANWFELTAAVIGLISIFFQIKQNAWYWGLSLIMVSMYIYVYIQTHLFALMILQVYYLGMSIYGWWTWKFGDKHGNKTYRLRITHTHLRTWIYLVIVTFALFLIITWALWTYLAYESFRIPLFDGLVTALSFAATWMLARKKLENWLVWLVADVLSCYLYAVQEMYPTLILFICLSILAVVGYFQWNKDMKNVTA